MNFVPPSRRAAELFCSISKPLAIMQSFFHRADARVRSFLAYALAVCFLVSVCPVNGSAFRRVLPGRVVKSMRPRHHKRHLLEDAENTTSGDPLSHHNKRHLLANHSKSLTQVVACRGAPSLDGYLSAESVDFNPDDYHLDVWQSTRNPSTVVKTNENNLKFFPPNTTIHTLTCSETDDQLAPRVKAISDKLEQSGVVSGAYEAYLALRPMAFRADLYRAMQLYDTGGLWLDDKIWLVRNFSDFVNVSHDTILLPTDHQGSGDKAFVHNGILWSRPRHPVMLQIIKRIVGNVQQRVKYPMVRQNNNTK